MAVTVRQVLLCLVLAVCGAGSVSLWHLVPVEVSSLLLYLAAGLLLGSFVYNVRYGHLETEKMIEMQLSRAAVLALALTMSLVGFSFLWEETRLRTVVVGLAGAAAMYVFLREKKPVEVASKPIYGLRSAPEPPPTSDPLSVAGSDNGEVTELDWEQLAGTLTSLGDTERQKTLQILRRIFASAVAPDNTAASATTSDPAEETDGSSSDPAQRLEHVIWIVEQEAQRLVQEAKMAERELEDADMLTKASELVEWALQKTPEITELDISDLLMAKAVADINHFSSGVSPMIVELSELKAIHNVDRDTAIKKSRTRALAVRESLALLQSNGLVLTEAMIASNPELKPFESITGLQVVSLGGGNGYVTFEGNGRAWALKQAFAADLGLRVEVRLFEFASSSTHTDIVRRVQRVRSWKKVTDEWPPMV